MMLFACGIGVGLFFYGVYEPIYHYTTMNRYSADPTMPDNTLAQWALNITLFHWGNIFNNLKTLQRHPWLVWHKYTDIS